MNNKPIGVFDSGIGGFTVLEKLYELMPNENYLYLSDSLNSPYGVKTEEEVEKIVVNNAKLLEKAGCKMIIVACNTASLYVKSMQRTVNIPVISVIEPTCKFACNNSKNAKIGVIATDLTIKKGRYQTLIKEENKEVYPVPCSEFVNHIENNLDNHDDGLKLVKEKLKQLQGTNIDTLIYGCTHFSLLEKEIKEVLGDIKYVDCGGATSFYAKKVLQELSLETSSKCMGTITVFDSLDIKKLKKKISWFKYKCLFKCEKLK